MKALWYCVLLLRTVADGSTFEHAHQHVCQASYRSPSCFDRRQAALILSHQCELLMGERIAKAMRRAEFITRAADRPRPVMALARVPAGARRLGQQQGNEANQTQGRLTLDELMAKV